MKRMLIGIAAAAAASAAFTTIAAPYEDYKIQIQRVQDAKLAGAAPMMHGGMNENMPLMQEMHRQLQQARSVNEMSPEQMRSWIVQHTRLMEQMNRQMMDGQAPMMGGQAPMMGGHAMPPRPAQ